MSIKGVKEEEAKTDYFSLQFINSRKKIARKTWMKSRDRIIEEINQLKTRLKL